MPLPLSIGEPVKKSHIPDEFRIVHQNHAPTVNAAFHILHMEQQRQNRPAGLYLKHSKKLIGITAGCVDLGQSHQPKAVFPSQKEIIVVSALLQNLQFRL